MTDVFLYLQSHYSFVKKDGKDKKREIYRLFYGGL